MSTGRQAVNSDQAPPPRAFYNQAIVANGFVFCSGQLPKDSTGNIVNGAIQDRAVCDTTTPSYILIYVKM